MPVALWTQTGGSIIRPAAFCGIVGFKPTFGRLCLAGTKMCAWSLDTLGILSRDVEDAGLIFGVLAWSAADATVPARELPVIGVFRDPAEDQAESAARAAINKSAARLNAGGLRVLFVEAPAEFAGLRSAQRTIARFEMARSLAFEWTSRRHMLNESTRREIDEGLLIGPPDYIEAKAHVERARPAIDRLFNDADVLMTFAAPGEAPRGLASTGSVLFNGAWTALGVPCVTLPFSTGPAGLPIGVQIIGRFSADWHLLRCSAAIEKTFESSGRCR